MPLPLLQSVLRVYSTMWDTVATDADATDPESDMPGGGQINLYDVSQRDTYIDPSFGANFCCYGCGIPP